jgi:hypothetical protein
LSTLSEADLLLLVADAESPDESSEKLLLKTLSQQRLPVLLALNKIDRVKRPLLLSQIEAWSSAFPFEATIPISAKSGEQVDLLLGAMEKVLPEGPPFFSTGQPHGSAYAVYRSGNDTGKGLSAHRPGNSLRCNGDGRFLQIGKKRCPCRIHATIHVERDSQKGIVIGKKGAKLKQIGEVARKEIENVCWKVRSFSKLFVRVQKNWTKGYAGAAKVRLLMILSFHPIYEADVNILCAGRQPDDNDLAAIRKADAVILPQGCGEALYRMARSASPECFSRLRCSFSIPWKNRAGKTVSSFRGSSSTNLDFRTCK